MLIFGGDPEAAAALADRAMVLNPGSATVWSANGWVRLNSGQPGVAFEHFEMSLHLDPLSTNRPFILGGLGTARFAQERFREAIPLLKQSAQLRPEWPSNHAILSASYGHLAETTAARETMKLFRSASSVDIRNWAAAWANPDIRRLILEGVAMAEAPTETAGAP
jgi:tetratricopeptide (TPR) repeat protein